MLDKNRIFKSKRIHNQLRPTKNTKNKTQTQEKQGETTKAISSKKQNQATKIIKH
ncbi:hypothetical protein KVD13_06590 [Helicobacter pylori]|nr:hypothetical protein KVD13_06590 [Helicobacter pylori]